MQKQNSYILHTNNAMEINKQLVLLCNKLLSKKKRILVLTMNSSILYQVNEILWKSRIFIPHGIYQDELWIYQPIILMSFDDLKTLCNQTKFSAYQPHTHTHDDILYNDFIQTIAVVVNFEHTFYTGQDNVYNIKKSTDILLWNAEPSHDISSIFQHHVYENGKWS